MRGVEKLRKLVERAKSFVILQGHNIWKLGKDDPRRVIHSIKPLFKQSGVLKDIADNVLWALMTVVVVLQFTAGATFCKGFNRGLGTVSAGLLAFLMEFIATDCGTVSRAIIIGLAVFVVGATATYIRFLPYLKNNYDYGVVTFVLTFNLIAVSSYRVDSALKIARDRFYAIAIGCAVCLIMSALVFPYWSGEDLHNSIVNRLEGLAEAVEACVSGYFNNEAPDINEDDPEEDPVCMGYKAILDSKSTDETMAGHASWEPRHSRQNRFPGKQYVKLGGVIRQFSYTVVALHGCIKTEIQTPRHVRALFKDPCTRVADEVSNALNELANSIRNRCQCSPEILYDHLHEALTGLNTAFKAQPRLFIGPATDQTSDMLLAKAAAVAASDADKYLSSVKTDSAALLSEWRLSKRASNGVKSADKKTLKPTLSRITITSLEFSEALPFAAFSSLLIEIVAKLEIVIEEVEELGKKAKFKESNQGDNVTVTVQTPQTEDQTTTPDS
uniref:Aluminum-activated malate transporter n=1 Tax=Daucus carota subsp. sativus TaxID=79200 RepID=A0A166F7S5_DAUCS